MQQFNTIIIAAISSRAYVQAAANAGFEVIAIDAFADCDTQLAAKQVLQAPIEHGQFVATNFLAILHNIGLSDCVGLCYGAGFEAQPDLLRNISQILPIIGNSHQIVEQCKSPQFFFNLCDTLKMPYPATQYERPNSSLHWLQKRIGGSGGAHIKAVLPIDLAKKTQHYYQKIQAGTPVSCLFLASSSLPNQTHAQIIGFNEQWCCSTNLLPYRYGGAVSHADLSESIKMKIENFVQNLVKKIGLKGLNSADFIVQGDTIFALEINPRLSASLDLYRAKKGDLFAAHVAACLGNLTHWPLIDKQSRAHQVIYANKPAHVPADMDWPDWVCDIPQPNSEIPAGAPLCTVVACARSAKLAKQKVLQRAAEL